MGKLILGYWNIRALAEPIRYALEYSGADYEDKMYVMGPAPDFDKSQWLDDKFKLGLDFPNLPYLIDGENKLTESIAILKYVCNKHGLMPRTASDTYRADMMEGVVSSYRGSFYSQFFTPEDKYEKAKQDFQAKSQDILKKVVNFIGKNKWLISNEITYLDFLFYACLKQLCCMYPTDLDNFGRLRTYVSDFEGLPKIKAYLSSGRFKKYPITNPFVRWGYKEEK